MTDTPTATATDTTDLTPPPAVQELLDAASDEGGPHSAQFTQSSVRLVNSRTREVVREVYWPGAGQFGTNLLRNILAGREATDTRASLTLP